MTKPAAERKLVETVEKAKIDGLTEEEETTSAKSTKKKKKRKPRNVSSSEIDVDRLRSYGVSTKKLKRLLYNKKQDQKKAA